MKNGEKPGLSRVYFKKSHFLKSVCSLSLLACNNDEVRASRNKELMASLFIDTWSSSLGSVRGKGVKAIFRKSHDFRKIHGHRKGLVTDPCGARVVCRKIFVKKADTARV